MGATAVEKMWLWGPVVEAGGGNDHDAKAAPNDLAYCAYNTLYHADLCTIMHRVHWSALCAREPDCL